MSEKENDKKKYFSFPKLLVEIVIVVLLFGIGFIGGFYYYRQNKDTEMIKELNTLIEESNKDEIKTVSDANTTLKNYGFALESLKPSDEKYSYAFNIETKKMCLVNSKWKVIGNSSKNSSKENYFIFINNEEEMLEIENSKKGYSFYLQKNFKFKDNNSSKDLSVNVGIDTGVNTNINSIIYTSSIKEGTIYTNDIDLQIYFDSTSKVNLYGLSNSVYVQNISELHSNGSIGYAELE